MSLFETVQAVEPSSATCKDRLIVIADDERTIVAVADGAGGTGSGHVAAEHMIREIRAASRDADSPEKWQAVLAQIDLRIVAGESTGVVVDLRAKGICGASVGDSSAWIIDDGRVIDLTSQQHRKPLLGSRAAQSVAFAHGPLQGLLLVASGSFFH